MRHGCQAAGYYVGVILVVLFTVYNVLVNQNWVEINVTPPFPLPSRRQWKLVSFSLPGRQRTQPPLTCHLLVCNCGRHNPSLNLGSMRGTHKR